MASPPVPPSPSPLRVDLTGATLLGTYQVERRLADGGMGTIYVARDTSLDRPVVVKVPHPRFLGEPDFRDRFTREITGLVRLEHPNIVRILARGEHEGLPFFVLQYLGGGSLEDRLLEAPDHRLGTGEIASWLRRIAETLDSIHGRGYLHRDVKPANILFDDEGHPFLSDFGVAKALAKDDLDLTHPGTGVGSPKYMAPEQGLGDRVGPAVDQYALAAVVYEALCGAPPFRGQNAVEVLVRKTKEDPDPIAERAPDVPPEAAHAVERALSRDPDERFESCAAFADAFLLGAGLTPPGTRVDLHLRRGLLSTRTALAGAALALLVVAGLLLALLRRPPPPEPPPPVSTLTVRGMGGPGAPPEVVLQRAGGGELRAMRYEVLPGARERILIDLDATGGVRGPAEKTLLEMQNLHATLKADVEVERVDEDGKIHYTITVREVVALPDPAPAAAKWRRTGLDPKLLPKLVGVKARGIADARGRTKQLEIEGPPIEEEGLDEAIDTLRIAFRRLFTPLPVEPVGDGAVWQVFEVVDSGEFLLQESTLYTLRDREGWRMHLESSTVGAAPPQPLLDGTLPVGVEARLRALDTETTGEVTQDLTQLAPIRGQSDGHFRMRVGLGEAKGSSVEFDLDMHLVVTVRRVEE